MSSIIKQYKRTRSAPCALKSHISSSNMINTEICSNDKYNNCLQF